MKRIWGVLITNLALAAMANAQITRTATFEKYVAGDFLGTSFSDPASGIAFSNATSPLGGFVIASGLPDFGDSNYLGSQAATGWAYQFGFTGALVSPANFLSIEISSGETGYANRLTLEGLNANGVVNAEQSGTSSDPDPFVLQIASPQYNISQFKIIATDVTVGYDNITYTYLPEPAPIPCLLIPAISPLLRRSQSPSRTPIKIIGIPPH